MGDHSDQVAMPEADVVLIPADELMDFLGLPREAKLDFYEVVLEIMPDEFWGELLEYSAGNPSSFNSR